MSASLSEEERNMRVLISMLRGVNVGAHNRIKMDALRALYESLKLTDARSYVQSGNILFRTKEKNTAQVAKKIQDAIERKFKFRPEVVLRSPDELRKAIAGNPFAGRREIVPGKLLVTFLAAEPAADAQATLRSLKDYPEELHLVGRELYIYFPDGAGKSKLPWASIAKLLKTTGTARNWNSVMKMLEMADEMDAKTPNA
jgi:uncharacterized protein (DUF1697 family)